MTIPLQQDFLLTPIINLDLSDEFKHMAVSNGFENLKELLAVHTSVLLKKQLFTYHVYSELIGFLTRHDSLHLLKTG